MKFKVTMAVNMSFPIEVELDKPYEELTELEFDALMDDLYERSIKDLPINHEVVEWIVDER